MEKLLKEITEQDIADMIGITLEQFKREWADGIIQCFAKQDIDMDIIDKFNSTSSGYPIRAEDLKKISGDSNG